MGDGVRPLIAVTTSEMRGPDGHKQTPQGEPPRKELALGLSYPKAVADAGGVPLVVPPTDPGMIDSLVGQVAGVCLSGGPDLDPTLYGAAPHAELGPVDTEIDHFELALARRADELGLPILAICRGMQTLNVARGGTLHQHLDGHRQGEPGTDTTHAVTIEAGSRLAEIMGGPRAEVNSFHHQAVDRLGAGLHAVARAEDGTIEAVEDDSRAYVIGVQWHVETLTHNAPHAALFEGLVRASRRPRGVRRAA